MTLLALQGGFADAPIASAHAFRAALTALSQPGQILSVTGAAPPAPVSVAAGVLLLTLVDGTTPVHLARGDFALHWQAHGLYYGVPLAELAPLHHGRSVVLNGSRGALAQGLAAYPDLIVLHITVPLPLLAQRLAARGRESLAEITDRLSRADTALPEGLRAVEIANDTSPEAGIARLSQALRA